MFLNRNLYTYIFCRKSYILNVKDGIDNAYEDFFNKINKDVNLGEFLGYNIPKELYRFEKVEINKDSLKEDLIKVRLIFNNNVANPEFAYNEDIRSYEVTNIDNGTQFKSNTENKDVPMLV